VKTALSIQLHPDRDHAAQLHAEQPDIYKDANPKPEMAIALSDNFIACCGFADDATIKKNFEENEVLLKLLPVLTLGEFYEPDAENPKFLKMIVEALFLKMDSAKEFL
jgi:mannose-6-phosphate isomerase